MSYFEPLPDSTLSVLKKIFECTEGMVSFDEGALLYRLAKSIKQGCIVEVGSYRGRSTVFLARGSMDGDALPVYAVDPHKSFIGVLGGVFGPKDRAAFYRAMLDNDCSEIVSLINLSSEDFSATWHEPIALLWIDGDHRYEGVKRDFECWHRYLSMGSHVAFDDATDPNLGPYRLINELTALQGYEKVAQVGKVVVIRQSKD